MAEGFHSHWFAILPSLRSAGFPGGVAGHKKELSLGLAAACVAALFVYAHWSIAVAGAFATFLLSALEVEPFLLLIIFVLPVGWVLQGNVPLRDIGIAIRLLAVVGFFFGRILRGRVAARRLLRPFLSQASLVFLVAVVASNVLGQRGWTRDTVHQLYMMVSVLGFFFVVLAWADSEQRLRKILKVLLCSTILTAGFAVIQEVVGGYTSLWLYLNPATDELADWDWRACSFLNNPTTLAGYLNLLLPFALACCFCGAGKWRRLGAWAAGLGFIGLVLTQSRGGLVAFGCVLVLSIFYFVDKWRKRLVRIAALAAVALTVLSVVLLSDFGRLGKIEAASSAGRLLLWGVAWDLFVQSPLFGVGMGSFSGLYGSYIHLDWIRPDYLTVNSLYLEILCETGLVGFATFTALVFSAVRFARRNLKASANTLVRCISFGVLGAMLTVIVHGLLDLSLDVSAQFNMLLWIWFAVLVVAAELTRESAMQELKLAHG